MLENFMKSCSHEEKFDAMINNSNDEELRENLIQLHGTLGLITALIITLTAPPDNTYHENPHDDSVWQDNPELGADIYGLMLWISTASCFFTLVISILILFQLSQIPKRKTMSYTRKLGFVVTFMAPVVGAVIGTLVFIVAALIQVSICHKAWVFWVSLGYLILVYIVIQISWVIMGTKKVEVYNELDPDWAEDSEPKETKRTTEPQE